MTSSITLNKEDDVGLEVEFPVERLREDFPILKQSINGKPLVYFRQCRVGAKAIGCY